MTARDLQGVVEATNTLRRIQEQPDPPEALATIPTLTRSDLPPANKLIPCEVTSLSDTRVLYHDLFTNGVVTLLGSVGLALPALVVLSSGAFAGLALPRFPLGGAFALSERAPPAPRNPARRLAIMPVQKFGADSHREQALVIFVAM